MKNHSVRQKKIPILTYFRDVIYCLNIYNNKSIKGYIFIILESVSLCCEQANVGNYNYNIYSLLSWQIQ